MNEYSEQIEEIRASREMPTMATTLTADFLNRFLENDTISKRYDIDIERTFEEVEEYLQQSKIVSYEEAKQKIQVIVYKLIIFNKLEQGDFSIIEGILEKIV